MTHLQLIRRIRFEMLRDWMEGHDAAGMTVPVRAYFKGAWKGSVKASYRSMERNMIAVHGEPRAVSLLSQAFRVHEYIRRCDA